MLPLSEEAAATHTGQNLKSADSVFQIHKYPNHRNLQTSLSQKRMEASALSVCE